MIHADEVIASLTRLAERTGTSRASAPKLALANTLRSDGPKPDADLYPRERVGYRRTMVIR